MRKCRDLITPGIGMFFSRSKNELFILKDSYDRKFFAMVYNKFDSNVLISAHLFFLPYICTAKNTAYLYSYPYKHEGH